MEKKANGKYHVGLNNFTDWSDQERQSTETLKLRLYAFPT